MNSNVPAIGQKYIREESDRKKELDRKLRKMRMLGYSVNDVAHFYGESPEYVRRITVMRHHAEDIRDVLEEIEREEGGEQHDGIG